MRWRVVETSGKAFQREELNNTATSIIVHVQLPRSEDDARVAQLRKRRTIASDVECCLRMSLPLASDIKVL